ncbi:hypothetical protein P152DRAFT_247479 [Eremomyces bilateralis CBS 781.70]|uniref:ATP-dependent DNA helicase n=1 Tax=Eremomyces bilateralis CBS 781.70 TaxID=1392243 RepID=A0A6G1GAN5_9PEZI|nr:uncharacterized protein P152DRAFT_247479 [Eremomyces bilateralis CBS 781.70]KAF1815157.1 hypothetical protein P152DRAFT_247479 [Eremomyces bilateralis CBS 781.70]
MTATSSTTRLINALGHSIHSDGATTGKGAVSYFLSACRHPSTNGFDDDAAPATKKRKLSTRAADALPPPSQDGLDGYILAERASLVLHGTSSVPENLTSPSARPRREQVALSSAAPKFLNKAKWAGSDILFLSNPVGDVSLELLLETSTHENYAHAMRIIDIARAIPHGQEAATRSKRPRDTPFMTTRVHLSTPDDASEVYSIDIEIYCKDGPSVLHLPTAKSKTYLPLFERLFPRLTEVSPHWAPRDYYECVHAPATSEKIPEEIRNLRLNITLYPFQERAVKWLLAREGVIYPSTRSPDADIQDETTHIRDSLGVVSKYPSYQSKTVSEGNEIYYSRVQGRVVRNPGAISNSSLDFRGGILSEEMGLGKTVELIALMNLNQRPAESDTVFDECTASIVTPTGGTLIITPPSILEQWKSELANHSPNLAVFHYKGLPPRSRPPREQNEATVAHLRQFDVVLTTYNVLAREIHYAKAAPERSLRHRKKHEPRKSPLVEMSWWRVCLDEAQMIESGVSQAAEVARLIPRCNAWAVTGTPFRKDVQDLLGLLLFLRYEPFCSSKEMWARIDKETFRQIFSTIALRHTKQKIRHELRLPPQRRVVITMPFTAIEDQHYSQLMEEMCRACGVTADGAPARRWYDPNSSFVIEAMRLWLRRLRQTCLHPEVGGRNRRALGRSSNAPMRTVTEVLEAMIEQNRGNMRVEERENISSQILQGHVVAFAKDDVDRSSRGRDIYLQALQQANDYVDECRTDYEEQLANAAIPEGLDEQDSQDEDARDASEAQFKASAAKNALRMALEVQHVCAFFVATSYFQIKSNEDVTKPDSKEFHELEKLETEYYDRAKGIRREMLHDTEKNAQRAMSKVVALREVTVPDIPILQDAGGIENRKVLEKMDSLKDVLDGQAKLMQEWRKKVISILLMPLVDEDDSKEITGDEYEDSTKAQDELYSYLTALRAMVADRTTTLTGLKNELVEHENKDAIRRAKNEEGHSPELLLELMEARGELKVAATESVRGVISQIRSIITSIQWRGDGGSHRAAAEISIIEAQQKRVQEILSAQLKAMTDAEKDLELFRHSMNLRLDFYRQLQQISDTVAPYKEELDETLDQATLDMAVERNNRSGARLGVLKTKQRFLLHLRTESSDQAGAKICVICQCPFETGVLTVCGHQYCKVCIREWWKSHRTCPICKRRLHSAVDFHDITYRPQEIRAQEEGSAVSSPSKTASPASPSIVSNSTSIYTDMSANTMNEIKSIELPAARSYGTKIDAISRHLLHIRETDPGAKSIVFSQYTDFLSVLKGALKLNKIGCSHIRDHDGIRKFRTDPSIECFLLDAKSDSSGLNLVNATYVFFCEPLINAAIELQAIARVHRIGQQRATTVYMYLISDTVEEAIYDISVARRLEHMGRSQAKADADASRSRSGTSTPSVLESALDAANSLELQQTPLSKLLQGGKGGGEVVEQGDLWNCLFGHPRRSRDGVVVSDELQGEVDRQLRGDASEQRRDENMEDVESGDHD